jgi:putative Mg2+ transporter-C (MgtC) family protein
MRVLQSGQISSMNHVATWWPQGGLQPALGDLFVRILGRLLLAAILGGVVGLERELKHRPAGLRTNMFISFGAAMFTVLSRELGGANDAVRIAAQIIPGIGFIGAGAILRGKSGVTGITTAATIFVVASIGMACGGGLYLLAIFATGLLFLALTMLGALERKFNLKPLMMNYSLVTEKTPQEAIDIVNRVLADQDKELSSMRLTKLDGRERIDFSVGTTRAEHAELLNGFRREPGLGDIESVPGPEIE